MHKLLQLSQWVIEMVMKNPEDVNHLGMYMLRILVMRVVYSFVKEAMLFWSPTAEVLCGKCGSILSKPLPLQLCL